VEGNSRPPKAGFIISNDQLNQLSQIAIKALLTFLADEDTIMAQQIHIHQ
jgi:hypothetical protein